MCKSLAISPWILFVCLVLNVKILSRGFAQVSPCCSLHTIHWPAKNHYIDHLTTFTAMDPMSCHMESSEVNWRAKYDFKPLEHRGPQCVCAAIISTWIHLPSPCFVLVSVLWNLLVLDTLNLKTLL